MVQAGEIYFPRAVTNELHQNRYIDTPEAWALDAGLHVQLAYEPSNANWERAMFDAGDVVDVDAEAEPADPKVLAQALDLQAAGFQPCVVTEDVVDRLPIKISLKTACEQRLQLECCSLEQFLVSIGFLADPGAPVPGAGRDIPPAPPDAVA